MLDWTSHGHSIQAPISLFLNFQGRLIKAAPEQCRLNSKDEEMSTSRLLEKLCRTRSDLQRERIVGLEDITSQLSAEAYRNAGCKSMPIPHCIVVPRLHDPGGRDIAWQDHQKAPRNYFHRREVELFQPNRDDPLDAQEIQQEVAAGSFAVPPSTPPPAVVLEPRRTEKPSPLIVPDETEATAAPVNLRPRQDDIDYTHIIKTKFLRNHPEVYKYWEIEERWLNLKMKDVR